MKQDKERTDVIFRKFKNKRKEVVAVFPGLIGSNDPGTCMAYVHVGQHFIVSIAITSYTKLATPEEYKDLKNELEKGIGYNLRIVKKFTNKHARERREQCQQY